MNEGTAEHVSYQEGERWVWGVVSEGEEKYNYRSGCGGMTRVRVGISVNKESEA